MSGEQMLYVCKCLQKPGEAIGFLEIRVIGGYEPPGKGAGTQAWVLRRAAVAVNC